MRGGACARRNPDRYKEPPIPQLNAVARPRRKHLPFELRAEAFKGIGDLPGFGPSQPIVLAALIKAAHVFVTKKEMKRSVAVGNGYGVVEGYIIGLDSWVCENQRVLFPGPRDVRDFLMGTPGSSAIHRAAHHDVDCAPVAVRLPRFAISQHGPL